MYWVERLWRRWRRSGLCLREAISRCGDLCRIDAYARRWRRKVGMSKCLCLHLTEPPHSVLVMITPVYTHTHITILRRPISVSVSVSHLHLMLVLLVVVLVMEDRRRHRT